AHVGKRLKIASWNINSVRARMALVERLIVEQQPDILCLQETKVLDDIFPAELFDRHGYVHRQLNGQRMHHGVAILSRVPLKDAGRHDWQDNGEARHVGARLECGIRLENVYVPAGGDTPDRTVNPKFGQKLDFIERMTRWISGGASSRRPSAASPGGAIVPPTGPRMTAGGGSIICGARRRSARMSRRIKCSSLAATGSGRPTMFR